MFLHFLGREASLGHTGGVRDAVRGRRGRGGDRRRGPARAEAPPRALLRPPAGAQRAERPALRHHRARRQPGGAAQDGRGSGWLMPYQLFQPSKTDTIDSRTQENSSSTIICMKPHVIH